MLTDVQVGDHCRPISNHLDTELLLYIITFVYLPEMADNTSYALWPRSQLSHPTSHSGLLLTFVYSCFLPPNPGGHLADHPHNQAYSGSQTVKNRTRVSTHQTGGHYAGHCHTF